MEQASNKARDEPPWAIAKIRQPDPFFTDGVDRRRSAEVEALVCTAADQDRRAISSPSRFQDWTCDRPILTSSTAYSSISMYSIKIEKSSGNDPVIPSALKTEFRGAFATVKVARFGVIVSDWRGSPLN